MVEQTDRDWLWRSLRARRSGGSQRRGGASRVAGRSDRPDRAPLKDALSADHPDCAQVAIKRLPAGTMIDHDHIAVAHGRPSGEYDDTAVCGPHQVPRGPGDVDGQVT